MLRAFLLGLFLILNEVKAQSSPTDVQGSISAIADSLYATGNYTKAINYYAKEASVKNTLQIARSYNAIGNFEKAIAQYENTISKDSSLQIARFELGKLLMKSKEYDEAGKLFSELVDLGIENAEYQYYLGEAHRELERSDSSIIAYKKAIKIDSTHLRSLFQLGKYFTIKQERDQALKYVDRGLLFYENDVALINLKALIYYNDNQYEKAIPWFEKVLELGERKEYVYEKLAFSYNRNWEFEKARKTYRTLIGINDQNSETYFGLAGVFQREKQLDSAEIYVKKAMDVQRPIFAEGYRTLAQIAREKGDMKSAFENYQLAHQEDQDDVMIYFNVCTVADQYYKDPKTKLAYYERFIEKFGKRARYMSKTAEKRISELKDEIHFAKN